MCNSADRSVGCTLPTLTSLQPPLTAHAGGSGYGAPSGDLLSMLNKGGQQRHDGTQQQHGGGPQDGPAFDASDFPSLSAAAAQSGQHRSADGGSETFAALLGSQKGGGAGQQQQAGPSFGEEDFPALPGSTAQPAPRQQQQDGSEGAAQLQQLQQQLGSLAGEGGGGFGGAGLDALRLQQQRQLQAQAALKGVAPGAAAAAAAAGGKLGMAPPPDRFGLLGLLSVIRMTGALRCTVVPAAGAGGTENAALGRMGQKGLAE